MIARLVVMAAGVVAAAAGAATWARRRPGGPTQAAHPAEPAAASDDSNAGDAGDAGDDLQTIKGIGGVSEQRLSAIGVTTFAQIAAWSDDDLERVATDIKVSAERIRREDWVGQARAHAKD
jgi:large subunit ribosomal protein L21